LCGDSLENLEFKTGFNQEVIVKKSILIVSALVLSGIALAAPIFKFGKDEGSNMMMKGETITISAYPKFKLLAKNINNKSAILIYEGKVAHDPFAYYEAALQKDGWKLADDAMMKPADTMAKPGDTMAKPGDTMTKPDDTMAKPGDTMAKPGDTMAKPGDTMAKSDDAMMMKKSFLAKFTMKNYTITLTSKLSQANRVTVDFELK
jgi:hypothetical protein